MKNKMSISLSERDKILLWLVASAAIVLVAWYFGFMKLSDEVATYQAKYDKAHKQLVSLQQKDANKEQYLADTVIYKNRFNQALSGYENGASQDNSLMFLRDVEKTTGSWIKSTTFSTTTPIYTFGSIGSSNPETAGTRAYTSDMIGYKTTLTVAYEAVYSDWKNFLTYLNNYYSKNTIDNISMSYNAATDVVSGTMTLSTYCITGSNRTFTPPTIDKDNGTDNIFFSKIFFPSVTVGKNDTDGSYILSDYDYYVLLNAAASDMNACVIGKKDDVSGDSVLASNENVTQQMTIHVWGKNGTYYIKYKLGNQQYPVLNYGGGYNFAAGNSLDLLIMSSVRKSSSDKSGVDISVINETDMDLNIKVVNDDKADPRVDFVNKTGIINIYNENDK